VPVRLVPFSSQHLPALEVALRDPDILRHTRVPEPPPPSFGPTWLARYEEGRHDGTREGFAIESDSGDFLGLALVPRIDVEAGTAELGYVVLAEARGRGVASEALRLLTDWAFAERGLVRLELMISTTNVASKKVAARAGYRLEGVLRSLYFKQGRRQDTELWSRLATDP
jgi:RimJ/RimL family protein N-acetyltransferase